MFRSVLLGVLFFGSSVFGQESPYGTGFGYGTKEDLELRLAWAKKDPCFDPGFSEASLEALELKKYWSMKVGPGGKRPVCGKGKSKDKVSK